MEAKVSGGLMRVDEEQDMDWISKYFLTTGQLQREELWLYIRKAWWTRPSDWLASQGGGQCVWPITWIWDTKGAESHISGCPVQKA